MLLLYYLESDIATALLSQKVLLLYDCFAIQAKVLLLYYLEHFFTIWSWESVLILLFGTLLLLFGAGLELARAGLGWPGLGLVGLG